jgi:hypothetical protein
VGIFGMLIMFEHCLYQIIYEVVVNGGENNGGLEKIAEWELTRVGKLRG